MRSFWTLFRRKRFRFMLKWEKVCDTFWKHHPLRYTCGEFCYSDDVGFDMSCMKRKGHFFRHASGFNYWRNTMDWKMRFAGVRSLYLRRVRTPVRQIRRDVVTWFIMVRDQLHAWWNEGLIQASLLLIGVTTSFIQAIWAGAAERYEEAQWHILFGIGILLLYRLPPLPDKRKKKPEAKAHVCFHPVLGDPCQTCGNPDPQAKERERISTR